MKAFVALLLAATAVPASAESPMAGNWTVDLSTEADGSYTKAMVLQLNEDGTVTGSFYDSVIEAGRWKKARGRTCVSFRTTDGQGPYHSAACLSGDEVMGQTWAEHRSFLFNWNAKRTK
jgi:hypothetical protein